MSVNEPTPVLVSQVQPGIAVVTLNRPDVRNALSGHGMLNALLDALVALDADPAVRAIVLTGAGTAFCSGGNLKTMPAGEASSARTPVETRAHYRGGIQRLPLAFERLELPVIAAVNGPAIGAGCDLTCMCDIRIAARSGFFAESFVTLGLIPGDGGAWLLPRIVGFAKASEMALTGARVDAEEALRCGLVTKVVDDADLMATALGMAQSIAANPPLAVRMTRRLLRDAQRSNLETVLDQSAALQAIAHATDDHREALAALRERRAPVFRGS